MTRDLAALLVVFAKGWTSVLQLEVERAGEHTRAVKGYRSPVVGLRITFWCHFVFLMGMERKCSDTLDTLFSKLFYVFIFFWKGFGKCVSSVSSVSEDILTILSWVVHNVAFLGWSFRLTSAAFSL